MATNNNNGAPSTAEQTLGVLQDFIVWLCQSRPDLLADYASKSPNPSSLVLLNQLTASTKPSTFPEEMDTSCPTSLDRTHTKCGSETASVCPAPSLREHSAQTLMPPPPPAVTPVITRDTRNRRKNERRSSSETRRARSRSPCPSKTQASSLEASSESDTEGFTLHVSKGKKRSLAKAASAATPKPPAKTARPESGKKQPTASDSVDVESTESSARKERPPPPVFIQDKDRWNNISVLLARHRVVYTHAKSTQAGIKVQVPNSEHHRLLTKVLRSENIGFHTYALEDERTFRLVLRGIPKEVETKLILDDLKGQNLPVREVHRLYGQNKVPFDLVLVVSDRTKEAKAIFNIQKVVGLSGISVEKPYRNGVPSQCHRCQFYGHTARFCFAKPRCVKCLGDHGTADCSRTREAPEPPSCVLCGTQGHTANYRGCPKAPKSEKRPSRISQRPPKPCTQVYTPKVSLVPAPQPKTNAWSKPPSLVTQAQATPVPTRAAVAPTVAPYRPPPARAAQAALTPAVASPSDLGHSDLASDLALVFDFAQAIDMEEVRVLAHKLRSAISPNDRIRATLDHVNVLNAIRRYSLPKLI